MAKEYIERGAVKFAYEMSLKNDTHRTEEASRIHAQEHRHILHLLDKIPSADVVEVVRCRDCVYRHLSGKPPFMFYTCTAADGLNVCKDNSFCSYGERRYNDAQTD